MRDSSSPSRLGGRRSRRFVVSATLHLVACWLLSWMMTGVAHADYEVEIVAPKPVGDLLKDFLDLSRYRKRSDLTQEQFDFLIDTTPEQVRQLVVTEGYFSPQTRVRVEDRDGKTIVHIEVVPNARTLVTDIKVEATGTVTTEAPARVDAIRRDWPLTVGKPFTQRDWDAAKDQGLQALRKRRYAAAKIARSEARIVPEEESAALSVTYDSGPPFTLGELQITGVRRYPVEIIRNVNPLRVGEEYDVDRLLELQRQIQKTPYYGNVIVGIEDDPANADRAPVKVQVTEFPTQRLRTGVGYSTDTGAHVEGRYSRYDVFGKAYTFDSQLKLEQRRQFGSLELAMPPDSKAFVNSVSTSAERTTLQGVELRSLRGGIKRARTREKIDVAYTLDYYRDELTQIAAAAPPPNTFVTPGTHQALVPQVAWTRRNVDNPIFPRRGNILSLQGGGAVKGLLTDQNFVRFYGRIKQFVPIGKQDLVILRGEAGAAVTKGSSADIPASLLFRAGGTESVRGYSYQSIGNTQNGTVYPTKYLVTASAEYQRWFTREWGGAVFYDVGTAANNFREKTIYHGVGVGARWRSPVGPVNVDVAYGLKTSRIRPHISLGIAF